MNYIVTLPELQTLAALLGGKTLFGLTNFAPALRRETVVQCVASLTQRGILAPEGDAFRCQPQVKLLVLRMIWHRWALLLTDLSASRPQICGYCQDGQCTLLEPLAHHEQEYRLYGRSISDLTDALKEDGYLPEERIAKEPSVIALPQLLEGSQNDIMCRSQEEHLLLSVEIYDGITCTQRGRGLIYRQDEILCFASASGAIRKAEIYTQAGVCQWLRQMLKGDERL